MRCIHTTITEADAAFLRVAVIHYWLVGMRGGEKVLEEILRMFPNADIFTNVADPERLSPLIRSRRITETFVGRLPAAKRHYQKYLGLMPRALEELDLRGYDLVISSESGPAKGVIVPPGTPHVCYVHSPMRYIWDHYPDYRGRLGRVGGLYFSMLAHRLRQWDVTSAARVDRFVANSSFVARRVRRYYGRNAEVVHPPVDLDAYRLGPPDRTRDYYLFVSELVRYKRADLVIEAFRDLDLPLLVVGDGDERRALAASLPPNVRLLGRVPFEDLPGLYQGARALIFPAEEDFGIVPVEAMACGTPVIAYGSGGVLDSVVDGKTGLFFDSQDAPCIAATVRRFETMRKRFQPPVIARHAMSFGPERFQREFLTIVVQTIADQSTGSTTNLSRDSLLVSA